MLSVGGLKCAFQWEGFLSMSRSVCEAVFSAHVFTDESREAAVGTLSRPAISSFF